MSETKVSVRYAMSLFDLAMDKKSLDAVYNDMQLVSSALKVSPELQKILANPTIKSSLKVKILREIFASKISADSLKFLEFIIDKSREELLADIANKFMQLHDDHLGIANVELSTAIELPDSEIESIKKILEKFLNKKVKIVHKIDEEIVGGFIAKAGDRIYDASLKHQLELLKKEFLKGGVSIN